MSVTKDKKTGKWMSQLRVKDWKGEEHHKKKRGFNTKKEALEWEKEFLNQATGSLGMTFKENCPDTRNTKVIDIYRELQEYGITPVVADPAADADEAKRLYGIEFVDMDTIRDMDAVILAVSHEQFKGLTVADFDKFYGERRKVLIDVKSMLDKTAFNEAGYVYWRL